MLRDDGAAIHQLDEERPPARKGLQRLRIELHQRLGRRANRLVGVVDVDLVAVRESEDATVGLEKVVATDPAPKLPTASTMFCVKKKPPPVAPKKSPMMFGAADWASAALARDWSACGWKLFCGAWA